VSGTELAAVIVAIASVVAVVLLAVALLSLLRTLTALRTSVEDLRRETLPVVSDMKRTVQQANAELERVDHLLESAESVGATVDSFSHLAYLAFSNPLIKVIAFAAGTGKAAKALRRD
jgi:uncharacterized protein YoxC